MTLWTLFVTFAVFLGVIWALLRRFAHLFLTFLVRNPLSGRPKVTILPKHATLRIDPIYRQEFHLIPARPDPRRREVTLPSVTPAPAVLHG